MSASERNDVFDAPDASKAATRLGKSATPAPARERSLDDEKGVGTPGVARRRSLIGARRGPVESGSPLADGAPSSLAAPAVISPLPAHAAVASPVESNPVPPGPPPDPATALSVPETASAQAVAAVVAARLTYGDEMPAATRATSADELLIAPLQTPSGRTPAPADVNGAWDPDPLSEEVPRGASTKPWLIVLAVVGGLLVLALLVLFASVILGGAATAVVVAPAVEAPVEVREPVVAPTPTTPVVAPAPEPSPVPAAKADNANFKAATPAPEAAAAKPETAAAKPESVKAKPEKAVVKPVNPGAPIPPRPAPKAPEPSPWDVPK